MINSQPSASLFQPEDHNVFYATFTRSHTYSQADGSSYYIVATAALGDTERSEGAVYRYHHTL